MALNKYIKNISGSSKTWVGMEIADSAYYEIQTNEEHRWMFDDTVLAAIAAGEARIAKTNDGSEDIVDVDRGKEWLQYSRDRVSLSLRGLTLDYSFVDAGLLGGTKWLRLGGGNGTSNNVPAIIPFNLKPIAISFDNQNTPSTMLIDFFRDRAGVITNLFTWDVSGKKNTYKTNELNASFVPSDRLAVRARQSGDVLANNTIVRIHFVILDEVTGEGSVT